MRENTVKRKPAKASGKKKTERTPSLSGLDELVSTEDSPHAVRAFIFQMTETLCKAAGINEDIHNVPDISKHVLTAASQVGPFEALSIIVNTAIETLTRYAPNLNRYNQDYQRRAEQYARALTHRDTPEHFREAFTAIYNDLLVGKTDWTRAEVVRATYAAMREFLDDDNYCGNAQGIDEALLILMETQLPAHVAEEARQASVKEGTR